MTVSRANVVGAEVTAPVSTKRGKLLVSSFSLSVFSPSQKLRRQSWPFQKTRQSFDFYLLVFLFLALKSSCLSLIYWKVRICLNIERDEDKKLSEGYIDISNKQNNLNSKLGLCSVLF